jgi:hypothetical protein
VVCVLYQSIHKPIPLHVNHFYIFVLVPGYLVLLRTSSSRQSKQVLVTYDIIYQLADAEQVAYSPSSMYALVVISRAILVALVHSVSNITGSSLRRFQSVLSDIASDGGQQIS